jgi:hypothetical protein
VLITSSNRSEATNYSIKTNAGRFLSYKQNLRIDISRPIRYKLPPTKSGQIFFETTRFIQPSGDIYLNPSHGREIHDISGAVYQVLSGRFVERNSSVIVEELPFICAKNCRLSSEGLECLKRATVAMHDHDCFEFGHLKISLGPRPWFIDRQRKSQPD